MRYRSSSPVIREKSPKLCSISGLSTVMVVLISALLSASVDASSPHPNAGGNGEVPKGIIYYQRLPAKVVAFPRESLGRYRILQPVKGVYQFHCIEIHAGQARGAINKPVNTVMGLEMRQLDEKKLKDLDSMKPDDLQVLCLSHTDAKDSDLDHVARLTGLAELELNETDITDAGLKKLKPLKNLVKLEISETDITNAGIKELAALPNLNELALHNCKIDDGAADGIAQLKHLLALNISDTHIKDAGIDKIIRSLPKLKVLRMQHLRFSDNAIVHIENLRELYLLLMPGSKVTDASISELVKLKQLRELDIASSALTKAGLLKLKRAMPKVQIDTSDGL